MNYLPQELIRRKRDGGVLSEAELEFLVCGIRDETVSEGQVAAFAMAVYFQGLNTAERVALTRAMTHSGRTLDWCLNGPLLDKHSTGGVGDKVSLVLAPLVAACGAYVPMVSGRGLGHTGGTLDKLDSIPGYDTAPVVDTFRGVVAREGCAIIGQTADLAPADRRLYAIRDVTATVESTGLITASILSKKLAAGLDALTVDVKTGSGAFAPQLDASRELAQSIVDVAKAAGLPTVALITDMNQVLGDTAGNALEVREALAYLSGARRNPRLHDVVLALGAEMLLLGGLADDPHSARTKLAGALSDGRAAERFARMVAALGGPNDLAERADRYLPKAPVGKAVFAETEGYVSAMDARAVGVAIIELGGGRRSARDDIDYAVGFSDICQLGEYVDSQRPLAAVHANSEAGVAAAADRLRRAITVAGTPPAARPVIYEKVSA